MDQLHLTYLLIAAAAAVSDLPRRSAPSEMFAYHQKVFPVPDIERGEILGDKMNCKVRFSTQFSVIFPLLALAAG